MNYNHRIRTILLAAAITGFATTALADTVCTVKAPAIRLRKSPNKNANILAILKKDMRVTTTETCAGGWVKVTSENALSGYVAGWALSSAAPAVVAEAITQTKPAKAELSAPSATQVEPPSNEKLAIQITELRLNVLDIKRDMAKMNKEIHKIKTTIRNQAASRKVASGK